MVSERMRRRLEAFLDSAEAASDARDWGAVAEHARAALAIEADNTDALTFLRMAEVNLRAPASTSTPAPEAPDGAPPPPQPESFAAGRYEVKRFLGEGGKKKVYLAHDGLLDRDVAFALIKTEGLDSASRARITREAQAMGRLGSHPHIVTVFDLGTEGEQPYMVTELMGGGDVEGLIEKAEEHRVPLDRALRIASEVCAGLEFAHARGIVHRDLKPGNVWLTADGVAKIGDFGLAVAVDRSRLTQVGMMVGTVSYMPPEQATGGEVTARSDLYSLGAMLYELVAGRPPFVGDENVAIIGQHLNTPPVAPSWHRKECPPGLEALILRLLAKDPAQRPASAAEVREALDHVDLTSAATSVEAAAQADDPVYRQTFVGREPELKSLQAAFDAAVSGQGGLVMVVGEPGIGKTALCEQLATYAAIRGGRVLRGNCYEEGSLSLPYLAFVEAMRSYVLSREPEDLQAELGTSAGYVARIVSEVRDLVTVEAITPGDPEDDRWRLLQAVTGFLRAAADVQPLMLLLEDLHWSDRGTLDLLLHLARNLQGARLLVVGTYRDVEVDRAHPLSSALAELRRVQNFATVRLRGLSIDEVQRMMSNIRGQEVSRARAELVYRQTEGHPLFVQEVLRYLVEEGITVRQDGRYVVADPNAGIPEGLRDVIGKRISRLSAECNRVLAVAAVIGRDFGFETLVTVSHLEEESVIGALEEALRVGIVQEQATAAEVRYRFAHAFFRQTLYEELIAPRRLRLHQEVARALEAQHARRLDEHAAELAEHFSYSTDPADLAKAVQYAERAAQRALAVFDYGEAARLLEKALGVQEVLDPDDAAKRCDLLLALGWALLPAGEPQRAAQIVASEAFSLADAIADEPRRFRAAALGLRGLEQFGGPPITATAEFREWASRADRDARAETSERVVADSALARVAQMTGRMAESAALRRKALELARGLGENHAFFQAAMWFFSGQPATEFDAALALAQELADRSTEGVSPSVLSQVLFLTGDVFLTAGERAHAEDQWRRLSEIAERTHDASSIERSLIPEIVLACLDGRLDQAIEAADRLIRRGQELGNPLAAQMAAGRADHALLLTGRAREALQRFDERSHDEPALTIRARRIRLLAQAGRVDEARVALSQLWADAPERDSQLGAAFLSHLVTLMDIASSVGDLKLVEVLIARLAPHASLACSFQVWWGCTPARLLGDGAALLDQPEQARDYYLQALEVAGRIRFRPEIALTHLGLAELLLAHDPNGHDQAVEHLDFAIAEFREMKMQPSLERALRHRGLLKA